jgi:SM-20-related protein
VSEERLSEAEEQSLAERAYFIRDGFLPEGEAVEAHAWASGLVGTLRRAGFGRENFIDATVRGDFTRFVDESPVHGAFVRLMEQLNESLLLGLKGLQLQLGHYPGNGALYVRHLDALPSNNVRRVTALLYLNPGWRPEHGGHLRMHLDPPLDVEPLLNRLVVFMSERVEHEVRPSFAPRLTLTSWYRTTQQLP